MGPRQTGKTTLLFCVYHELRQRGEPVAFLDLSAYRMESVEQSYAHAALKIWEELESTLTAAGKLHAIAAAVDSPIRFREFLLELAKTCQGTRIVVLLDEVGPFMSGLGFFETLRSISASGGRESERAFKKYLFCFAGTVDLQELTSGQNSPLANVCRTVYLDGFGLDGTRQLVNNLKKIASVAPDVAAYVHSQTLGHPYLTQRICASIQEASAQRGERRKRVSRQHVDEAIDHMLEGDANLRYIALQLQRYPLAAGLLRQMMVDGLTVPFSLIDPRVARLFVIGVVRRQSETEPGSGITRGRPRCVVCNPIYDRSLRQYFDSMGAPEQVHGSRPGSVIPAGMEPLDPRVPARPPAVDGRNYVDFHVRILPRPDPGQPFPLSVESWAGMGTGHVELDVQDKALWEHVQRLMRNELDEDDLRALGTRLWNALFGSPDIERRWAACQAEAGQNKGIRIKLEIAPPILSALPWEYLYDPDEGLFPALSPRTPITRYTHSQKPDPPPLALDLPLRILLVSAMPREADPLDVEREQQQILTAMDPLVREGKVEIRC